MNTKKKIAAGLWWRTFVAGGAMMFFLGGCGLQSHPRQQSAAASLPPNATWLKGSGGVDSTYYQWVSPHAYFTLAFTQAERAGDNWVVSGMNRPVIIDEKTGIQRPLTLLTKILGTGENAIFNHTSGWKASPDGKWLLFLTHDVPQPTWMAVSTDGKRLIKRSPFAAARSLDCSAWLPDSRHWAEVVHTGRNYQVVVYSLDASTVEVYPIVWSKDINQMYFYDPSILVLGFTSANHLLTKGEANDGAAVYFDLTLSQGTAVEHLLPRTEKNRGFLFDVALSPDGKRLAWRSQNQALCVSDINGSNERVIVPQISGIESVRWVPDHKRVSFGLGYSLYTAPVN